LETGGGIQAQVSLNNVEKATADEEGRFRFTFPWGDYKYKLSFSYPGYENISGFSSAGLDLSPDGLVWLLFCHARPPAVRGSLFVS
jgi:hypothetical protein